MENLIKSVIPSMSRIDNRAIEGFELYKNPAITIALRYGIGYATVNIFANCEESTVPISTSMNSYANEEELKQIVKGRCEDVKKYMGIIWYYNMGNNRIVRADSIAQYNGLLVLNEYDKLPADFNAGVSLGELVEYLRKDSTGWAVTEQVNMLFQLLYEAERSLLALEHLHTAMFNNVIQQMCLIGGTVASNKQILKAIKDGGTERIIRALSQDI